MNFLRRFVFKASVLLFATLFFTPCYGTGSKYAVKVSAIVEDNPAKINLVWEPLLWNGEYKIYKRTSGVNTSWSTAIATLPHDADGYTDTQVQTGIEYEYKIDRGVKSNGYIRAGIKIPVKDNMGKVIFVVDNSIAADLSVELDLMEEMMVADGWQVVRRNVSPGETVVNVRTVIRNAYNLDPQNSNFLFHAPF